MVHLRVLSNILTMLLFQSSPMLITSKPTIGREAGRVQAYYTHFRLRASKLVFRGTYEMTGLEQLLSSRWHVECEGISESPACGLHSRPSCPSHHLLLTFRLFIPPTPQHHLCCSIYSHLVLSPHLFLLKRQSTDLVAFPAPRKSNSVYHIRLLL